MQNYKKNLATWAKFALSQSEENSQNYKRILDKLSKEDIREMLAVLAGYFGATPQGQELVKGWLENAT